MTTVVLTWYITDTREHQSGSGILADDTIMRTLIVLFLSLKLLVTSASHVSNNQHRNIS